VREQRAISADVALRLGKYFGMTPQFWMNLQTDYDRRRRGNVSHSFETYE
jgi:addiction module HigA family antidote